MGNEEEAPGDTRGSGSHFRRAHTDEEGPGLCLGRIREPDRGGETRDQKEGIGPVSWGPLGTRQRGPHEYLGVHLHITSPMTRPNPQSSGPEIRTGVVHRRTTGRVQFGGGIGTSRSPEGPSRKPLKSFTTLWCDSRNQDKTLGWAPTVERGGTQSGHRKYLVPRDITLSLPPVPSFSVVRGTAPEIHVILFLVGWVSLTTPLTPSLTIT